MNEIVLYEYNFDKPELSEELLMHYGVKGMHWGVRRYQNYDGTRIKKGSARVINKAKQAASKTSQRRAKHKAAKVDERKRIQRHKDEIAYMSRHPDKYSTKDINEKLNRLNAETRLSEMNHKLNPTAADRVKSIWNNKKVRTVAAVALGALIVTGVAVYATKSKNDKEFKEAVKNLAENTPVDLAMNSMYGLPTGPDALPRKFTTKEYLKAAKTKYGTMAYNMGVSKIFQALGLGDYVKEIIKK